MAGSKHAVNNKQLDWENMHKSSPAYHISANMTGECMRRWGEEGKGRGNNRVSHCGALQGTERWGVSHGGLRRHELSVIVQTVCCCRWSTGQLKIQCLAQQHVCFTHLTFLQGKVHARLAQTVHSDHTRCVFLQEVTNVSHVHHDLTNEAKWSLEKKRIR